jgi:hypothetical protein
MPPSKFETAKDQIKIAAQQLDQDILKQVDVSNLLDHGRAQWELPKNRNGPAFAKKLIQAKCLRGYSFPFPHRTEKRYAKPHVPMLEVLQSIKPNSYYTHASATQVHGIMSKPVENIYLNFEQSPHERSILPEQSRIDAAFKSNPRQTNKVIEWEGRKMTMTNGMYTGQLGVVERYVKVLDKEPANIRLTDLERTLIDSTVRPYYSGGVEEVLRAFERARDSIDATKLANYLFGARLCIPVSSGYRLVYEKGWVRR